MSLVPDEINSTAEKAGDLLYEILEVQDNETILDELSLNELKALHRCRSKAFELFQLLLDLKSRIQLRKKSERKPVKTKK